MDILLERFYLFLTTNDMSASEAILLSDIVKWRFLHQIHLPRISEEGEDGNALLEKDSVMYR